VPPVSAPFYFALYQQLDSARHRGEDVEETEAEIEAEIAKYKEFFKPDFFDLIIVDECHRGSAKADSRWRKILDYFSGATQIGMTATPKETKYKKIEKKTLIHICINVNLYST